MPRFVRVAFTLVEATLFSGSAWLLWPSPWFLLYAAAAVTAFYAAATMPELSW